MQLRDKKVNGEFSNENHKAITMTKILAHALVKAFIHSNK